MKFEHELVRKRSIQIWPKGVSPKDWDKAIQCKNPDCPNVTYPEGVSTLHNEVWPNGFCKDCEDKGQTDRRSKRQSDFDLRPGVRWHPPSDDPEFVPTFDEPYNEVEDLLQELINIKEAIEDRRAQLSQNPPRGIDPQMQKLYQQLAQVQPRLQEALNRRGHR